MRPHRLGPGSQRAGIVGRAIEEDGIDDVVTIGASPSLDYDVDSFIVSLWARVETSSNRFDIPFWNGGSSDSYPGFDIELGTAEWTANLHDGIIRAAAVFGVEPDLVGEWRHLALVCDREAGLLRCTSTVS